MRLGNIVSTPPALRRSKALEAEKLAIAVASSFQRAQPFQHQRAAFRVGAPLGERAPEVDDALCECPGAEREPPLELETS